MNATQITALSQIQAQAIVHARKSSGSAQQIQTQIQLQAQALVHAHTQAQIAAGIYKGDAPAAAKKDAQLLTTLTPSQLQQQEQLKTRHEEELKALKANQDESEAEKNKKEVEAMEATHKKQVEELHATFRKQNAAAEYAGVKVQATVPNPTTGIATAPAVASIPPAISAPAPLASSTALALPGEGEVTPSATSPEFLAKLNGILNNFWSGQLQQVQQMPPSVEQDFKNHNDLPLARIKRIMKSDEDVRMISAEAPVLFAKACELFILELTLRSWTFSQHHKRRTLQKEDIKEAIQRTDIYDFLVDVIQ
jgi:nuclear transcription factor Y gamma